MTGRRGAKFFGDCDDFTLTCADVLRDRGVSPADLRIQQCLTEHGERHLVLIVAGTWLVDCRFNRVIEKGSVAGYTWLDGMDCNNVGVWGKYFFDWTGDTECKLRNKIPNSTGDLKRKLGARKFWCGKKVT